MALKVSSWVVLLFLVLPILIAVPVSLTPKRCLSLPEDSLSLRHYVKLLTSEEWLTSIGQSTFIAVSATLIATLLGTLCAVGLWRLASRLSEVLRGFLLMPLIVPPIVSALAFYRLWGHLGLIDSFAGMILAHAILGAPFIVITVSTSLANFDLRLEQASRNLGASIGQTLRYVIIPGIRPGILSGAVFAFIFSWDEIVVTLFIQKQKSILNAQKVQLIQHLVDYLNPNLQLIVHPYQIHLQHNTLLPHMQNPYIMEL